MKSAQLNSGRIADLVPIGQDGQPFYLNAEAFRDALALNPTVGAELVKSLSIPKISTDGSFIDWYIPFKPRNPDGQYRIISWASASPEEKAQAQKRLRELEQALNRLGAELQRRSSDSHTMRFARYLTGQSNAQNLPAIHFPNPNYVFIVDGIPVITFWGFTDREKSLTASPFAALKGGDTPLYESAHQPPVPPPGGANNATLSAQPGVSAATPAEGHRCRLLLGHRCILPSWLLGVLLALLLLLLGWLLWSWLMSLFKPEIPLGNGLDNYGEHAAFNEPAAEPHERYGTDTDDYGDGAGDGHDGADDALRLEDVGGEDDQLGSAGEGDVIRLGGVRAGDGIMLEGAGAGDGLMLGGSGADDGIMLGGAESGDGLMLGGAGDGTGDGTGAAAGDDLLGGAGAGQLDGSGADDGLMLGGAGDGTGADQLGGNGAGSDLFGGNGAGTGADTGDGAGSGVGDGAGAGSGAGDGAGSGAGTGIGAGSGAGTGADGNANAAGLNNQGNIIPPELTGLNNDDSGQGGVPSEAATAQNHHDAALQAARQAEAAAQQGQDANAAVDAALQNAAAAAGTQNLNFTPEQVASQGTKVLDGNWQTKSGLMDSANGKPLQLGYAFHDGKGKATITRPDGVKCTAPISSINQNGNIVISSQGRLQCPGSGSYQIPQITCKPEANGQVKCHGQYGQQAFPIVFSAEK